MMIKKEKAVGVRVIDALTKQATEYFSKNYFCQCCLFEYKPGFC